MEAATAEAEAIEVPDMLPDTAKEAEDKAAKQRQQEVATVTARLNRLVPKAKVEQKRVAVWSDEERRAVIAFLDSVPESHEDVPPLVAAALGRDKVSVAFALLRTEYHNALRREDRIFDAERAVSDARLRLAGIIGRIDDLKEDKKDAEGDLNAAVVILQKAITDQANGQNTLDFDDDPEAESNEAEAASVEGQKPARKPAALAAPAKVDPAETAPIEDLQLGKRITEGMHESGIKTVGKLIEQIARNEWWMREIPGVGEKGVDKITDALNDWRRANPAE